MKNFKLETKSLSKTRDLKIQLKIYILVLRKYMKNIFWLGFIVFAIPTLVFGIAVFWVFQNLDIRNTSENDVVAYKNLTIKQLVSSTLSSKYKDRAKKRARVRKAERYKVFAMVRSANVRKFLLICFQPYKDRCVA